MSVGQRAALVVALLLSATTARAEDVLVTGDSPYATSRVNKRDLDERLQLAVVETLHKAAPPDLGRAGASAVGRAWRTATRDRPRRRFRGVRKPRSRSGSWKVSMTVS